MSRESDVTNVTSGCAVDEATALKGEKMDGCFCSVCQPRVTISRLREKEEKMQATYQPKRKVLVGKSVNGGPWLSMGAYDSQEEAERAVEAMRTFHLERCPKDDLRFNIEG